MAGIGNPFREKAEEFKAKVMRRDGGLEHGSDGGGDELAIPIGIDLGTTNSSAAYVSPETGKVETIPLETSAPRERIPSVVFFDQEKGIYVVGDQARRRAFRNDRAVRAEFKREMPHASIAHYDLGDPDKGEVRRETPQTLSAIVLREIRERSERELSERHKRPVRIRRAVITVPANFPEEAPAATMAAAKDAGFEDVQLLDEPTAAAIAYALHRAPEVKKIVVFDWGGGTLDCSILASETDDKKPFRVANAAGDPHLGGKDFDDALVAILAQRVAEQSRRPREEGPFDVLSSEDIGISANKRALWRTHLKERAEQIKMQLSEVDEAEFTIDSDALVDHDGEPLAVSGAVTRDEFEAATRDKIDAAIAVLRNSLAEAELSAGDIDRVVLVGGTTLMPAVRAAIVASLGIEPFADIDRLTAVAQGAAAYELLTRPGGKDDDSARDLIVPLASHHFGVRVGLDQLDTLILKNAELPSAPVTRTYLPLHTDARQVSIPLCQYDDTVVRRAPKGELPRIEDADLDGRPPKVYEIGRVVVDDLTGENRAVDVTFEMDRNRILSITVKRQADGREYPLVIDRHH